jgi:hypothetical protein
MASTLRTLAQAEVPDMARPSQAVPYGSRVPRPPVRLLPIPTDGHVDIGAVLSPLAADRRPRIDVLIGPDDAGKSTLLRQLAIEYRTLGDVVCFFDLSLVDWRRALVDNAAIDVAFVDHLDRVPESDAFHTSFAIIDRALPALFTAGMSRLILALGTDWRAAFQRIYRLSPEALLRKATPTVQFESHGIRPYTSDEIDTICGDLGLDSTYFEDQELRRSGVLAMARSLAEDNVRITSVCLRDALAQRWIEAANDTTARTARRAMWDLMGVLTLREDAFALSTRELSATLGGRFREDTLRAQAGGPLRWEGEQVQSDSPAWGDVAAARTLRTVIDGRTEEPITRPLRASVLRALVELSDQRELASEIQRTLYSLRGADFAQRGYLGPIAGTLSAQLAVDTTLTFRDLWLQGPDQAELPAVDPAVASVMEDALLRAMAASIDDLLRALSGLNTDTQSANRGGYECWEAARRWARDLPLRAKAEDAVLRLLPTDGSWRYEDILDVSVTGATSQLMERNANSLADVLTHLPAHMSEYLADIWDGINDGAWDQIDARSSGFVASLYLPSRLDKTLYAVGCRMQRAHLGAQNARGWRLINCDVHLADFRSCHNVELVDFTGTNWWSAILPPPARYHHSRHCSANDFLQWCQSPPWTNPYYTADWPAPFD